MSAKINSVRGAVLLIALLLVAAGCTPAGPRALLKGKKYLDSGDYTEAAAQFKVATELLATNAAAWNYYGVALQRTGAADAAATAYKRALDADRDLLEARLNLGTLYLEQNQPEEAKTEFTAYTLRRPNEAAGWLKLGSAQLKLGETGPAERSFSSVLALKTSEAEAYNGLGLARVQRGKAREAAQFFNAAVKSRADYAPAILNLAAVNQQYLHDNKAALENYRNYLALTPKPANWSEVAAIVDSLGQAAVPMAAPPSPAPVATAEPKPQPKISVATAPKPAQSPRAQETKPAVASAPPKPASTMPVQVVRVAPEPQIVTSPTAARVKPEPTSGSPFIASGVTPLPGAPVKTKPVVIIAPAPVDFPRYNYLSPRKPPAGDRRAADRAFTQARKAEQDSRWATSLQDYRQAAALDPSWFEAQFNAGVVAQRLKNYPLALASYEAVLAIQPGSADARYNFALTLKAAGYAPDAANELKNILAAKPNEARAHLALANLCAQALHDPAQAREHYKKVLELDPLNPQTADIRFWLAANPG
jgi:tetratricopeptide (TPR) repeat protein